MQNRTTADNTTWLLPEQMTAHTTLFDAVRSLCESIAWERHHHQLRRHIINHFQSAPVDYAFPRRVPKMAQVR